MPRQLSEGDGVRTGFNAQVRVELRGGSVLEASGNSSFTIEADNDGQTSVAASLGFLRLTALASGGRAVTVRSPVCLAKVRGERAALSVVVSGGGNVVLEVDSGLVGVEDIRGRQMLLNAGRRIEVDLAGLREPTPVPTPAQRRAQDFMSSMRRELGFELGREADFAAAAKESRREEHRLGRVLTDLDGRRVRVEEFVVRPSADRLALVVLNGRADGLSFYSWDGVFDRALPRDLAPVFSGLAASRDAPTDWTLLSYSATRSNGVASLVERASGGHQVDVNSNGDPSDDVAAVFDAERDVYRATGGPVYKTVFDRWGLYADGTLRRGWTGSNLQSYLDAVPSTTHDPLSGAALAAALPGTVVNTTFPDAASARRSRLESYGDGTSVGVEDFGLEFAGGVAGRGAWGGSSSGDGLHRAMLDWGFEQRVTFNGRTIRLTMPARDFLVTGQLP